jgi:hypothetical protein
LNLDERISMGKILVEYLEKETYHYTVYDDEWNEMIRRALTARMRMKSFYFRHNKPLELLDLINKMDSVITKMVEEQSKRKK